jgi:phage I-like protein
MKLQPTPPFRLSILSAALSLDGGNAVQLLPAGEFAARDGRPGNGQKWKVSDAQGVKLAADLSAISQLSAFHFDYEHQTIHALTNGKEAPASGWATEFEWRPGVGLFATNVEWTPRAKEMIGAKEYRYISPVISWDDKGNVTGVLCASLVNYPALLGMSPLGSSALAALAAQFVQSPPANTSTENSMTLLQLLIAQLGLSAQATDTEALSAVAALKAKSEGQVLVPTQLAAALAIKTDADVATALSAVEQLKTQAAGAGQTTMQTIAALQGQVTLLMAGNAKNEVSALVEQALKDGKLVPATKNWAEELGKTNVDALKSFLAAQPVIALGSTQSGGKEGGGGGEGGNGGGSAALSGMSAEVAARLGLSEAEFNGAN